MQAVGRVYCFGQRRCVHIMRFGGHVCKGGLRFGCAQCLRTCYCAWHRPLPFLDSIHRCFEQEFPYHIRCTIIQISAQICLQLHANHVPTADTDPLVVVDPSNLYVRCHTFFASTRLHCPSVWSTCGDKIRDSEYAPEC